MPYARFMAELRGLVILAVVVLVTCVMVAFGLQDDDEEPAATTTTATRTTEAPAPYKFIDGDGTHQMGGMGGKNWGTWQARNPTGKCVWSIRLINPYTGAVELDSGGSERTRVSVQPSGDVSLSGRVDGGRVVFITSGCGTWQMVD